MFLENIKSLVTINLFIDCGRLVHEIKKIIEYKKFMSIKNLVALKILFGFFIERASSVHFFLLEYVQN